MLRGLVIGILLVFTGCTLQSTSTSQKKVVKECILPAEQSGTLSGRWRVTPIPLAFKDGDFSSEQIKLITQAADVWNDFYTASQGFPLFDYGTTESPNISAVPKPGAICSQGLLQGDKYNGHVVIYKQAKWSYTNHDAIALTSFCPVPADPLPNIYMAIIELNFQDFFVEGAKLPDLKSILIHELGHLMGLNHSCATKSTQGFPDCSTESTFFDAVMFPVILFDDNGMGEVRHSLATNDQGRANCLYEGN